MPLTIYRRHSDKCRRVLTEKKRIPVKALRQYTDCDCAIWIEGTLENGDVVERASLHTRDWKAAEAQRNTFDVKGKDAAVHGKTIDECTEKFIDAAANRMKTKAHNAYKLLLGWLVAYCHQRNKMFMADLTVDLCEDFKVYGIPKMQDSSKSTYVSKFRAFLKEAERRSWITIPLSTSVTPWKFQHEQKEPFSDDEVEAILRESAKLNGGTIGFATNAETFTLLLRLMLETGMRVSDAVRYDPRHCERGKRGFVYTFEPKKQRKNEPTKSLSVYMKEDLNTAIANARWFSARLPFAYRPTAKEDETDYLAQAVYERMKEIGLRCVDADGKPAPIEDCRPHRLRDTFAVRCLLRGMALEDVSKLLGHSSVAVTERYYAKWVRNRKLKLEDNFFDTMK